VLVVAGLGVRRGIVGRGMVPAWPV